MSGSGHGKEPRAGEQAACCTAAAPLPPARAGCQSRRRRAQSLGAPPARSPSSAAGAGEHRGQLHTVHTAPFGRQRPQGSQLCLRRPRPGGKTGVNAWARAIVCAVVVTSGDIWAPGAPRAAPRCWGCPLMRGIVLWVLMVPFRQGQREGPFSKQSVIAEAMWPINPHWGPCRCSSKDKIRGRLF